MQDFIIAVIFSSIVIFGIKQSIESKNLIRIKISPGMCLCVLGLTGYLIQAIRG